MGCSHSPASIYKRWPSESKVSSIYIEESKEYNPTDAQTPRYPSPFHYSAGRTPLKLPSQQRHVDKKRNNMSKHGKRDNTTQTTLADEGGANNEPRHISFHKRVKQRGAPFLKIECGPHVVCPF